MACVFIVYGLVLAIFLELALSGDCEPKKRNRKTKQNPHKASNRAYKH